MADKASALHKVVGTNPISARRLTETTESAQRGVRLMERASGTIQRRRCTHKPGRNWSPGHGGRAPWHWGEHGKAQLSASEDGTRYVVTVLAADGDVRMFQGEYATLDAALRNGAAAASNPEPASWVAGWNGKYPEDTPVLYWTGAREGDGTLGRTRSAASVLGGTAVVWVTGHGACIALTHVCPISEGEAVYWQRREDAAAG